MPGPTAEVLNDDIKGLRDDLHKVEVALKDDIHKIDVTLKAEIQKVNVSLKDEIRKGNDVLKDEIHRVDVALSKLSAEFNFAKWLLGLSLSLTLSGSGGGIWWAATINANLKNLEMTTSDQFTRLEASLAKILEQTKPAAKP